MTRSAGRRLGRAALAAALAAALWGCVRRDDAASEAQAEEEWAMAQASAASVLHDIAEAREHIRRDQPQVAEWDVERADRDLDLLEQTLPDAEPLARLWLAREEVEYEEPQAALPDLDVVSVVVDEIESRQGPLPQVREHLTRARQSIEQGDRQTAMAELDAVAAELSTHTEGLPFDSTRGLLADARVALRRDDLQAADASLYGAGRVMTSFIQMLRSPLPAARWSLDRAAEALASGEPALAQRRLQQAQRSLQRLAADEGYPGRALAAELAVDLARLERGLTRSGSAARAEVAALSERARGLPESQGAAAQGSERLTAAPPKTAPGADR